MSSPKSRHFGPALIVTLLAGAALGAASAQTMSTNEGHMNHSMMAPNAADSAVAGSQSAVPWDEAASRELEMELHRLHEIWNTGDIASLKKYIIGDEVLPTFELDPRTHQPITLQTKQDLDNFVTRVTTTQDARGLVTKLDMPKAKCRATATWGICTEECTVNYDRADNGQRVAVDKLRATQIAVKTPDGWRWIQWHMSDYRPPQSVALP